MAGMMYESFGAALLPPVLNNQLLFLEVSLHTRWPTANNAV